MNKIEKNNRKIVLPPRRKDTKETLLAFVPLRQKKYLILFLCSFIYINLFQIIPVYSQSDSLLRYLEIATKNNPTVQQRFIEYQAALQRIPQVGGLSDPELSLGLYLNPMELINGNQVADIRLMQMFPWFGVLKNAKDEMSLMAKAKFELFRDTRQQLFFDVQRTWYELYKIQKDITISEKNIEILSVIERIALVKLKSTPFGAAGEASSNAGISSGSVRANSTGASGMQTMSSTPENTVTSGLNKPPASMQSGFMGSSSDNSGLVNLYRIQIETGELENNIALLKNQLNTILAQFNAYLNRPAASPVFTHENIALDSLKLSLIAVSDSIHTNNPMLLMLDYEKQSIEARKKMVTRMSYPMVGLGLNYSLLRTSDTPMGEPSMNGKDMVMPMVTITLPIYRKKYIAMQTEADLLKSASRQNYQATVNSLQTEYYQALQLYQDAQRRIILNENQYLLASKSLDLVIKSFSASSSGLTDVLRIRQQTLDYELKHTEAVADLNIAIALLNRLISSSQILNN